MFNKFSLFIIILSLITMCTLSPAAKAQKHEHSISANPIGLVFGVINATYENKLSKENSFTVSGYYWSYSSWNAFGVGGSYRWYIVDKHALEGFSFGPVVSLGFWSWDGNSIVNDNYDGGTSLSIGGEAAYKWIFGSFVVEPQVGFSINLIKINGLSYRGFGLGVNLGYAW